MIIKNQLSGFGDIKLLMALDKDIHFVYTYRYLYTLSLEEKL